ncbi:hypothetical protein [Micromonospora chersina]|uniref:hypothetical protein n=1 Tax=Micromonospora chersina TaxID=47854 RepID=UPI003722DBF0
MAAQLQLGRAAGVVAADLVLDRGRLAEALVSWPRLDELDHVTDTTQSVYLAGDG